MLLFKLSSLTIFIASVIVSVYEATISPSLSKYLATSDAVGEAVSAKSEKYYWTINEFGNGKVAIQSTNGGYVSFMDKKIITSKENGTNHGFILTSYGSAAFKIVRSAEKENDIYIQLRSVSEAKLKEREETRAAYKGYPTRKKLKRLSSWKWIALMHPVA
ncbi:hypothetical protein BJ944DRAFT_239887 [Cunninghamella echinulata]|nr:hypothetical protein BJ944DRAFT_239887 [Cunninghamella echinulata]